ncbi:hypothetical protein EAX62_11280 [Tessaracoccus antarcticus]|uniref:Uncharacterized protein n=1 Tax=Tessaracoccus antarcticus TaxID=2479848 RepID=A0A3M0G1Q0_9ACTN|nr:hypothetical protein EAX62_11280 [Tessaracoccus antarcticus]
MAPHLVWPEDRAWCLACEVDEEIEFAPAQLHMPLPTPFRVGLGGWSTATTFRRTGISWPKLSAAPLAADAFTSFTC